MIMNYAEIFNNLVLSFKNAFDKTGVENAVIGISGGIDSALACAAACKALGSYQKNTVLNWKL